MNSKITKEPWRATAVKHLLLRSLSLDEDLLLRRAWNHLPLIADTDFFTGFMKVP